MINILSVDTSQELCSAAVSDNGAITAVSADSPANRSKQLLSMVNQLLEQVPISRLDALAFAAGPGSLTGLKVASCVMQGLKLSLDKPIIKISSLQALAWNAYQKFQHTTIISCLDAKMGQVYYGIYRFRDISEDNIWPETIQADRLVALENFPLQSCSGSDALVVGDGCYLIEQKFGIKLNMKKNLYFTAEDIVILSDAYWKKYGIISEDTNPIYLRAYD